MKIYSDGDWAGCKEIWKPSTGGCVMQGKHSIKARSRTQALVVLSSGEFELYASPIAAAETLGTLPMAKDFSLHSNGDMWGDASAALGIIHRNGLGKTRHIQTGLLWTQQTAAEQRFKFNNVLGKEHPAHLSTKHLEESICIKHIEALGNQHAWGRAAEASRLHVLSRAYHHEDQYSEDHHQWQWLQYLNGREPRP